MGNGRSRFVNSFEAKPIGSQATVFVFDWDDTLLCTSSINSPDWSGEDLSELQQAVQELLSSALVLGEVLIVTNAAASWVAETTKQFFPGMQALLQSIPVISARSLYEYRFPSDPFAWKRHTFKDIFVPRKDSFPDGMNVIVMGDSSPEIEAAIHTSHILGPSSKVKTLKLVGYPGVNELVGQLRRVTQGLDSIVNGDQSMNYKLLRDRQTNLAAVSSWNVIENTKILQKRLCEEAMPLYRSSIAFLGF